MSLKDLFQTDPDLEKGGIKIDYGSFWVKIRRAGGANKAFEKMVERKTRPHRRAIQTESIDPALSESILMECYAQTVMLDWGGELEKGVKLPKGKPEEYLKVFREFTDFYRDIVEQSQKVALFRKMILEDDAKN